MMKKTALPLLLAVFSFCYCSDNPKNPASKGDKNEAKTDVNTIAPDYIDSLRSYTVDLAETQDIKTLLCQQWEHEEDKKEVEAFGASASFIIVFRGLAFFNDGTVVRNPRSYVSFGTWQYDDAEKTISINLGKGDNYRYKIKAVSAYELQLIDLDDAKPKVETYLAQAFSYKNNALDPFYGANNQWRIKPKKSETPEAINERVKACVRFYSLFYNDNLLRDTSVISFLGLPSCFSWYNSGIGVQMADKLSEEWIECFYNKEQALKAHAILEDLITQNYHWTRGRFDWRVKTAKVLLQMVKRSETLLE